MTDLEYRGASGEIREVNDSDKTFSLRIVTYGVVDSYGSNWAPDVFTRSLETKLPSAAWAHDWSRIIGSLKEYDLKPDGVDGLVKFADFADVPDARMAWSLLKDGHIKDTSFGFKRNTWSDTRTDSKYKPALDGEKELIRVARLDEVSPVLVGAVPGSKTFAVRSEGRITRMDAGSLLVQVASGAMDLRAALNALEGEPLEDEKREEPKDENLNVISEADADLAISLMRYDRLFRESRVVTSPAGAKGTAQLKEYWAHGDGAKKIRWGTEGDHTRCVRELSKYVTPAQVHGLCTNIAKLALGGNGQGAGDGSKGGFGK